MKWLLILMLIAADAVLTGCTQFVKEPPAAYYEAQRERVQQIAAIERTPLFAMTGDWRCTGDCSLAIYAPNPLAVPEISEGHTSGVVAAQAVGAARDVVKWGVGGYVAAQALRRIGDETTTINAKDSDVAFTKDNVTVTSTDVGADMIGDTSTVGDTSISNATTQSSAVNKSWVDDHSRSETNIKTVGDYSGDRAGNSGRIESPDDMTHRPTVVTQPKPVVVHE